jgi:ppGpp synthetase/RelA/SpoT-type nucleotidyltranferase
VEWSQGHRQPDGQPAPVTHQRPVDPRTEWSQGHRQADGQPAPGTHQQPVDPRAEWLQGHQPSGPHHSGSDDNFGSSDGADLPPAEREVLDAVVRDVDSTLQAHPETSSVVKKLVADPHKLNVTDALRRPWSRQATLDTIKELAEGRVLRDKPLLEFLDENPGQGTLFEPIPDAVNKLPDGTTRKDAFVRESQQHDPARAVGAEPTPDEMVQVREYQRRLVAADSVVEAEVRQLIEGLDAQVSVRTKDAAGLIDKVQRMVTGTDGRAPRPQYKVGDVIDAIGARITVEDTARLAEVIERVRGHYGFGDEGRILEVENMYAQPKAHNPAYRVVPMIVKVEHGGQVYTFELQLTTRRASIAADINHNTIYKPYLEVDAAEQAKVARMFEEAAALEQIENRGLNNG